MTEGDSLEAHYAWVMADHTIRLTVPSVTLTGQDVTFEVYIDGAKRGELHISEGGIDWWPRSAKSGPKTKSWEQLARFMES